MTKPAITTESMKSHITNRFNRDFLFRAFDSRAVSVFSVLLESISEIILICLLGKKVFFAYAQTNEY